MEGTSVPGERERTGAGGQEGGGELLGALGLDGHLPGASCVFALAPGLRDGALCLA